MQSAHKHKVLLVGSGLMASPLVDHLLTFNDTFITIASNIEADAQRIATRNPKAIKGVFLDVFDVSVLR